MDKLLACILFAYMYAANLLKKHDLTPGISKFM